MHVTRINAIGKYNVSIDAGKINQDLEQKVPNNIQAIAHNYNHLHEQPTVFYAVALSLIAAGDTHDYTVKAAWTYVGIRIFHSMYQVLVNKVLVSYAVQDTQPRACSEKLANNCRRPDSKSSLAAQLSLLA